MVENLKFYTKIKRNILDYNHAIKLVNETAKKENMSEKNIENIYITIKNTAEERFKKIEATYKNKFEKQSLFPIKDEKMKELKKQILLAYKKLIEIKNQHDEFIKEENEEKEKNNQKNN